MVIWRVLVVVETQIVHYNLYETSAVDPRAAYGFTGRQTDHSPTRRISPKSKNRIPFTRRIRRVVGFHSPSFFPSTRRIHEKLRPLAEFLNSAIK